MRIRLLIGSTLTRENGNDLVVRFMGSEMMRATKAPAGWVTTRKPGWPYTKKRYWPKTFRTENLALKEIETHLASLTPDGSTL